MSGVHKDPSLVGKSVVTPDVRGPSPTKSIVTKAKEAIVATYVAFRFDQPKRISQATTPELRPRSYREGSGRREMRAALERRYVVLPSNAGPPTKFTAENIAKAMVLGRERRDAMLADLAAAQTA